MGWVHHAAPEVEAQSQYREILGVCLSLTVLMVITVSLRLGLRAHARRLGAADYVMFMSMALVEAIPLTWSSSSASFTALFVSPVSISIKNIRPALTSTESRYGLGLPLNLRPKQNLPIYKKLNYAGRPFYQIGIAGFKASLCLSYLRLLTKTSLSIYRILIWTVLTISTLGHIAGALALIFNCRPVQLAWRTDITGTCLPVGGTFYGLAIFTIICDLMIIFLPIPLLLRLKIKPAQKAGVVCLFLLGLFTTICSIMRLTQIHRVAYGDGNSTALVLWGTIEFNVGNIITCIPYLAPLLKGLVRDFRSNSKAYESQGHYVLESWKDPRSQLRSTASAPVHPRRTPSEELIMDSLGPSHGGIEMTVEVRVSLESL
ncbi:unnamed protein product [Aspergillus oryzae RIB40]|uniref:DNA, SC020 n=1 Tax=Aspergillus oryzae (strain ATCC 42149 / RIB 40) TaxID=510516 RepID=Q2U4M4_ASPOR|nr:unnamed protein product [Aspergillus oryzae RIB40]BAE63491.1 unnamed protein product [Aspergillus oryzae RIB40]